MGRRVPLWQYLLALPPLFLRREQEHKLQGPAVPANDTCGDFPENIPVYTSLISWFLFIAVQGRHPRVWNNSTTGASAEWNSSSGKLSAT